MKVLSLFDGISCGQVALNIAGIKYTHYYASEIEKEAIKVTQHNYPETVQLGDVRNVRNIRDISLLMAGSPCQGFSFAGKQMNFADPRSALFFEFVRLIDEARPKYFLLENVPMKDAYLEAISGYLGVMPVIINSNVVSAQNRVRYYWTNIPFDPVLPDKKILIRDIVGFESEIPTECDELREEIRRYTSRPFNLTISKSGRIRPHRLDEKKSGISEIGTIVNPNDKCVTITASHAPKTYRTNPFKIHELSRDECESIQNLPKGYTSCISDRKAKKAIGNGWTVDIIAHILKGIS